MTRTGVTAKSWRYANAVTWKEKKKAGLTAEGKPNLEVATPVDFGGLPESGPPRISWWRL